jgi:hypothetical protein
VMKRKKTIAAAINNAGDNSPNIRFLCRWKKRIICLTP